MGCKKLLPGNSVLIVISWKNKPILSEIILLFIKQNTIPYMEFCLVINVTRGGNWVVTRPPIIATRYVIFVTTLNTR